MLNSDELGEKGESRFKELCADAGLICNKADRDRAGWDFIVEFPFQPQGKGALDSRPSPISCHVQVKTLWESSTSFQMRLSSAERLAKEIKPSFIVVLKVNEELKFTKCYLIHILGARLSTILKRLRLEEAKGTSANKINQKKICLRPLDSEVIELKGELLRQALEAACGGVMQEYVLKKRDQLEKLGFEGHPYEVKVSLHIPDGVGLVDMFLGLVNEIEVSNLHVYEHRFGIKLPHNSSDRARLKIEPNPFDDCSICIRGTVTPLPIVFKGQLFVPAIPNLPEDEFKALIKSEWLTIVRSATKYSITWGSQEEQAYTPERWADYCRMMMIFASGQGEVCINALNKPINLELPVHRPSGMEDSEHYKLLIELCEDLSSLLKRCGVISQPKMLFSEIQESWDDIESTATIFSGEATSLTFATKTSRQIDIAKRGEALLAKGFAVGTILFAFYALASFRTERNGELLHWELTNIRHGEIRLVKSLAEFDSFIERVQRSKKIDHVMRLFPRPEELPCSLVGNA